MTETECVERARSVFAEVTGVLEDAALVAADGQAAPDVAVARQSCDRLITALEPCLGRLQRLRRQLG